LATCFASSCNTRISCRSSTNPPPLLTPPPLSLSLSLYIYIYISFLKFNKKPTTHLLLSILLKKPVGLDGLDPPPPQFFHFGHTMSTEFIVKVEESRPESDGKPSAEPVYRSIYAIDGLMDLPAGLESPWQ